MEESRLVPIWLTFLLLLHTTTSSENSVQIKFYEHQKLTSSTLIWITPSGPIPDDAVVGSVEYTPAKGLTANDLLQMNISDQSQIKERKIYICRAYVNGNWVPGLLRAKPSENSVCVVSIMVKRYEKEKYEILQNVDRAARLLWREWDKLQEIPKGAVSAGESYIAHSASPRFKILNPNVALGMSFLIGKIDPGEGIFGKMSVLDEDGNVVHDVESGYVLVEIEPVLYELSVRKLSTTRQKIITRTSTILGEVTLRNDDEFDMKADSVISYSWRYFSNWGPGKAMLKGLPTTIYILNSTYVENITWGIPSDEQREGVEKVESWLPAGTARLAQLQTEYMEIEVPYTGTLLSVFNDNTMMNRTIHGFRRYTTILDVKTVYGPLYFIQNQTLVPTTTTTTTEPPPTTTPIPTTTAMTNEITKTTLSGGKRTTEDHNMLSDDSDAMQLKKRDESSNHTGSAHIVQASNGSFFVSLLVMLISGYIVNRIT